MNNIASLTNALSEGQSLNVTGSGKWYIESQGVCFIRRLFKCDDRRLARVSRAFSGVMDRLEQTAVRFNGANEADYSGYVKFGDTLRVELKKNSTRITKKALLSLDLRLVGLKYRIEKVNGGWNRSECDEKAFSNLIEHAENWKKGMKLYHVKDLSKEEKERLNELREYPEFMQLIDNDRTLRNNFLKWLLRDNNGVRQFVEFPATCKKLKMNFLAGRMGRFGPEMLEIVDRKHSKKGGSKKVLTLPFEAMRKNILNDKKVIHFRGDYDLTLKEVFKVFQNKNKEVGNLELFGVNGISNWNAHHLGWWDGKEYQRIDLDVEQWWKQLPAFEEIDRKEVMKRFALDSLEEGEWVVAAKGTSEFLEIDFDKSHGYLGLAIPTGNGMYQCMSMGKFAERFPVKDLEKLYLITNTVRAKISYPDENEFYSHRRQAISPVKITPEEAKGVMEEIKKDLIRAREGNIVFQFAWENCAFWPQMIMSSLKDREIPEYYRAHLMKSFPHRQPMRWLFDCYRKAPKWLQPILFHVVMTLLLCFKGVWVKEEGELVYRSLWNSPFHKTLELYYPSLEHEKIEKKEIPGKVTFGHMELLA